MAKRLTFFDIPVYRISEEKYMKEFEAQQFKHFDKASLRMLEEQERKDPYSKMHRRERQLKSYGGHWQFNEVVGYVRLRFDGDRIRGSLWMVDKERVVRTRNKVLVHREVRLVPETSLPRHTTNRQIYDCILSFIELAKQHEVLKQRYLDTSVFERIGPYIDWKAYGGFH